jgi:hypothetical protein
MVKCPILAVAAGALMTVWPSPAAPGAAPLEYREAL